MDYKGDGLAVTPTEDGASLHCVFQRLDGEATPEGLWLTSTVTNTTSDRFRVTATEIGRRSTIVGFDFEVPDFNLQLAAEGTVSVDGQKVRFVRPVLTEEYSLSMDGVRQDFIVEQAPPDTPGGELVLQLDVVGSQVEPAADGAWLVLARSGRKIAYSRLRVTDATGTELSARMEVCPAGDEAANFIPRSDTDNCLDELSLPTAAARDVKLAVVVNDADAVYPVRIDPTFSDANWVSMGDFPGTTGEVFTSVIDGSGNLYIGGVFTAAGSTVANNIAQWNGSSWLALGSGINGNPSAYVYALALSGSTLYAGGYFTTAGGTNAGCIAQWNGSSWLALGSGINGNPSASVYALALSGSNLYASGEFSSAGGTNASCIAQWNGSSWSALGSGISGVSPDGFGPVVSALAVSGSTLYVGGDFTTAGGTNANSIAEWNGSSWLALGSGMNSFVSALAVSGSTLYAGGNFSTAGDDTNASYIAEWNGSSWFALGSGISGEGSDGFGPVVNALAVLGSTLYVGGDFSSAGGSTANSIAQWKSGSWSGLGSGISGVRVNPGYGSYVSALAVSGSALYAGGFFSRAGGIGVNYIAEWNGSNWLVLSLGSGISGVGFDGNGPYVSALAASGNNLYVGGDFSMAGDATNANCVALWNGSSWLALGSGISGVGLNDESGPNVSALAVSGSTLYVGGDFSMAGGTNASCIAQWNGSNWFGGRFGDGQLCGCAGGVGQHIICGRRIQHRGWHQCQLHRGMER